MADLNAQLQELQDKLEADAKIVAEYKDLLKVAEKKIEPTLNSYGKRLSELSSTEKQVKSLLAQAQKANDQAGIDRARRLQELLAKPRDTIKSVNKIRPSTGSLFVRLFLGRVNVRVVQRKDQLRLRDEYNKFKGRANILYLFWPCFAMLVRYGVKNTPYAFKYTQWITVLSHIWLLYYYVSLALRENILLVNGSNIRPWWIYHHYISALMSVIMLTWPKTPAYTETNAYFMYYFAYQGLVQILQSRYQAKRHYTLRSLGLVSSMDVTSSETLTEMHSGLYVLLAFVGVAQAVQVTLGVKLLQTFYFLEKPAKWWEYREEIQILTLGLLFILMAVCNFWTTLETVMEKRRRIKKKRQGHTTWQAPKPKAN